MNETQTEAKPEVTETLPQGSAPETQVSETGSPQKVDATQETASRPNDVPNGLKKELYTLRAGRRQDRQTIETLQARLDALEKSNVRPVGNDGDGKPVTSIFDNPDLYLQEREKKIVAEAEQRILSRIEEQNRVSKHKADAVEAEKWLLSQNYLKDDPMALDEINVILDDPEIQDLTSVNPKIAAREAYARWCSSKGIDPSRREAGKESTARATTPKPSGAVSSSGQKVWTMAELKAYAGGLDSRDPEFAQKWAVVEKALKEKRFKA